MRGDEPIHVGPGLGERAPNFLPLRPEQSSEQPLSQVADPAPGDPPERAHVLEQHRRRAGLSRELARRREGQSALVRERAVAAERRLHRRWRSFEARGKRSTVAAVAVARELAGWCWSLAVMDA